MRPRSHKAHSASRGLPASGGPCLSSSARRSAEIRRSRLPNIRTAPHGQCQDTGSNAVGRSSVPASIRDQSAMASADQTAAPRKKGRKPRERNADPCRMVARRSEDLMSVECPGGIRRASGRSSLRCRRRAPRQARGPGGAPESRLSSRVAVRDLTGDGQGLSGTDVVERPDDGLFQGGVFRDTTPQTNGDIVIGDSGERIHDALRRISGELRKKYRFRNGVAETAQRDGRRGANPGRGVRETRFQQLRFRQRPRVAAQFMDKAANLRIVVGEQELESSQRERQRAIRAGTQSAPQKGCREVPRIDDLHKGPLRAPGQSRPASLESVSSTASCWRRGLRQPNP